MTDPLLEILELCQIVAAKLRDEPNADQAQLMAYLKQEIAAKPKLAAAIQSDSRILQINQGDTTGFQIEVMDGTNYIAKNHIHVDAEAIKVLQELLREYQAAASIEVCWHEVSITLLQKKLVGLTTNPLTSGEGIAYRTEQIYVT